MNLRQRRALVREEQFQLLRCQPDTALVFARVRSLGGLAERVELDAQKRILVA
jgi:hypothetical protein